MFVGNLTPLLIITGACGVGVGSEFADLQVSLLQNAMLVAGLVTLLHCYSCLQSGQSEAKCQLLWVQALGLLVCLTVLWQRWAAVCCPMVRLWEHLSLVVLVLCRQRL